MKPRIQIVDLADLIQIVYAVGCNYLQEKKDKETPLNPDANDWSISSSRRYVHMLLTATLESTRTWKTPDNSEHNVQTPLMFLVNHLGEENDIDELDTYFEVARTMAQERLLDHLGEDEWMDWQIEFIDDYTVLYPKGDRRVLYFEHLRNQGKVTWDDLNNFDA